eukprot:SAG22_NODE_58_length_23645_cov_16.637943_14_plen_147_part_00
MPRWLARGKVGAAPVSGGRPDPDGDGSYSCTHSINHYIGCSDPPYDFELWGDLIYKLGRHLVERYGEDELAEKWAFEVWCARLFVRAHVVQLPCRCRCWCCFSFIGPSNSRISGAASGTNPVPHRTVTGGAHRLSITSSTCRQRGD